MRSRWTHVLGLGLSIVVGILATPRVEVGATLLPWAPVMADLDVYRMAGQVLLEGGNVLTARAPGTGLMFIYPPFAAFFCVPLALLPTIVVQFGWIVLCAFSLYALMFRLGLRGWVLPLATAGVIWFVEPVHATFGFGQLGIILVALVYLDLVPGPTLLGSSRRILPEGLLTGFATALKLTPGLFAVMLWLVERRRPALVIVGFTILSTGLTTIVLPDETIGYIRSLTGGDTRTTEHVYYLMNQSLLGGWTRLVGDAPPQYLIGLLMALTVALGGAYVGARWYRAGHIGFGVTICGVATLLASPISWTHHFVWVVPLGILLLDKAIPDPVRIVGWLFVGWVSAAAFARVLPYGSETETAYNVGQRLISSTGPLLGVAFLVLCLSYVKVLDQANSPHTR